MITIFRNDGKIFDFQNFKITSLDGFGKLDVVLNTKTNAFDDGEILLGKRIRSKSLIIEARSNEKDFRKSSLIRDEISNFFRKNFNFTLVIEYKNNKRQIVCELQTLDLPTNNIYQSQSFLLEFKALDPFYQSVNKFGKDIASIQPMFAYPWISPIERVSNQVPAGFVLGTFNFDRLVKIENDGDKPSDDLFVTVTATGLVQNFKLKQTSEIYVLFTKDLQAGDVLELDFKNGYVSLNGENANQFIDKQSTYFTIPLGESVIGFEATTGENVVSVKVDYHRFYGGI